jgi:hypothetical protein
MMRYDIEETAVYEKVRTVVWEDGAARPLLPDPAAERSSPRPAARGVGKGRRHRPPHQAFGIRHRNSEWEY